ncbi:sensor histidine kinase [Spirosoma validum]|uniref:histidine kinase n=1 Tax=Spirosoma validum TaxID=2771355 RepID=A0A927B1B3_9BACT|nr:sensor histidine kinase [Spirosoma validum]MBD2753437.1 sensor histidine kinase [Spirosoma validum]
MGSVTQEIIVSFVAFTIVLFLLILFIIIFSFLFQRRQAQFRQEREVMRETYQRELLQSQIETQNQTLEYVGQELHDNIGQMLSVAILQLNGLDDDLTESSHQVAVRRMIQTIDSTIQAVRQLAKTLDSGTVRRFGLRESLSLELERIGQTRRFQTQLDVQGKSYELSDESEIILFRMAQESLNNAIKHARAKILTVTIDYQPDKFILTIADDGKGFDLTEATSRQAGASGSGVNNLYQRAKLLGGTCAINAQPNSGTCIEIKIPNKQT